MMCAISHYGDDKLRQMSMKINVGMYLLCFALFFAFKEFHNQTTLKMNFGICGFLLIMNIYYGFIFKGEGGGGEEKGAKKRKKKH